MIEEIIAPSFSHVEGKIKSNRLNWVNSLNKVDISYNKQYIKNYDIPHSILSNLSYKVRPNDINRVTFNHEWHLK